MFLDFAISPAIHADTPWTSWNVALFEFMRGTPQSPAWLTAPAIFMAEWLLCGAIAVTVWQLWRRRSAGGTALLVGAWLVSNRLEALASNFAWHPRPFDAGFGPALIAHAANNSMPSSHVTLGLILVGLLLMLKCPRSAAVVGSMTLALAWARIYVGVHWPFDMLGAAVCAALSLAVVWSVGRLYLVTRRRIRHARLATSA